MKLYNIVMIYSQDEKNLLFCRRKKDPYKGKLNFPGGKIEKNELPMNAA